MRRRITSTFVGATLVLVACGSPGGDAPPAAAPDPTRPVDTTSMTVSEVEATAASGEGSITPTDTSVPEAPSATETTPGEAPATSAPSDAPSEAPSEARAPDGCSTDNTATDVADGPPPAIEVRAAAAGNPLPDLAVRRVNCAGGWVNLKNELPGELPLLVWFWAPH
jgi:5'-nucleotidase / UDP-sugar diphosphatase